MVQDKGGRVYAEVYLPDILKEQKLSLHGEKRSKLGPKSELAINKMTQVASKIIVQFLQGNET